MSVILLIFSYPSVLTLKFCFNELHVFIGIGITEEHKNETLV